MPRTPIESIAMKIIKDYGGSNDYILYYKKLMRLNPYYVISHELAKYVIKNHRNKPNIVDKWVEIHPYSADELKTYFKKPVAPEKIYIAKILSVKPVGSVHIWGKLFEDEPYNYSIFLSSSAFTKLREIPKIDWNKYSNRPPKSYQVLSIETLLKHPKFILADDMGLGKCLIPSTLVYTPTGKTPIGNLKVGDHVIGSNGKKTKVTGVYPQNKKKKIYEVIFNDGYSIKCSNDHMWAVTSNNGSVNNKNRPIRYVNLTVEQMLDKELELEQIGTGWNEKRPYKFKTYYKQSNGQNKWQIPIVKPIEFENEYSLTIEPYLLGVILGDGHIKNNGVIGIALHKDDFDEIFDNQHINETKSYKNNRRNGINNLKEEICGLKLNGVLSHTKFIPEIYKYTSIEDRLSILQGLMDTDGYCVKSKNDNFVGTEYCSVSEQLAKDVAEIVHSLGGIVRMHTKIGSYTKNGVKHICKKVYRLNIKLPEGMNPFRLKRKADEYNVPKKYKVGRYIKDIKYVNMDDSICISVNAPDKLYVIEHAIVTHNTYSSIVAALELGVKRILIVCPATLKLNWKREIMMLGEPENSIAVIDGNDWRLAKWIIVNYDILRNFHHMPQVGVKTSDLPISPIQYAKFDLVIADECFPYNTIIKTEIGDLPIGYIVEKNLNIKVLSYDFQTDKLEYKEVDRFIKKNNDILLKIFLDNGIFIECTPNHKIYIYNKGYIEADKIQIDDELFNLPEGIDEKTTTEGKSFLFSKMFNNERTQISYRSNNISRCRYEMPMVRKRFYIETSYGKRTKILRPKLLGKMEDAPARIFIQNTQQRNIRENSAIKHYCVSNQSRTSSQYFNKNEKKQPYAQSRNSRENEKIFARQNIFISGGEWENNTTATKIKKLSWSRMDNGACDLHRSSKRFIYIASDIIQSRYRKPKINVGNRSRWKISQDQKMAIFGQKENKCFKRVRVDSIEILESGSRHSTRKLFNGDTSVYNIEVKDNHNYIADGILVSNCHRLKDASSGRSKIFNNFVYDIPNRWLLTGTPITNKPIDYFNLLQICDSPLADNWQRYVKNYCDGKRFTNRSTGKKYWVASGHSNLDSLHKYTQNLILRRLKTDIADLPDKIIRPVYLPLTSTVIYNKYLDEYQSWLDELEEAGEVPPVWDHLTRLIKIRQTLSLDKIPSTVEMTNDFIEENKKVVIFTCFTETLDYLMEQFNGIAVRLDGGMSLSNRQKSVDAFQNNAKIKVFISNIIAGGVGITLTAGEVVIFNDLDWVPSNHVQAEDRCVFRGQLVLSGRGYLPIEKIEINDVVYTHKGRMQKVINKSTHLERKKLQVNIKYFGFNQPLSLTEDHMVQVYDQSLNIITWKEAAEVKPRIDFLTFPMKPIHAARLETLTLDEEFQTSDTFINNFGVEQKNGRKNQIAQSVELTDDLLFAFGWYVAEGWSNNGDSNKGYNVSICGNAKKETELVQSVIRIFKDAFHINQHNEYTNTHNCISSAIYSKQLASQFIKWFGHDSYTKRLPLWVFDLNDVQLTALLNGYFKGDGYYRNNQQSSCTASPILASQLMIVNAMLRRPISTGVRKDGNFSYFHTANKESVCRIMVKDDHILLPISEVVIKIPNKKNGADRVYDLEIENDSTFVVGGAVVHNCMRIGQKNNVNVFYPLIDGTLDIEMFDALTTKKEVINTIMGDDEKAFNETMAKYVIEKIKYTEN